MAFRSDRQRRAAFFRMGAGAGPRQLGRRLKARVERSSSGALAAGTGAAVAASMAPWVTHVPAEAYRGRGLLRGTGAYLNTIRKMHPYPAYYAAIPALATAGALAHRRYRGEKVSRERALKAVGAAGGLGLGTWMAERSLLHMVPIAMRSYDGRRVTNLHRAELLLGHGLPLAAAAGGMAYLAHRVRRRTRDVPVDPRTEVRRVGSASAALTGARWAGIGAAIATGAMMRGSPLHQVSRGLDRVAVPTYLAHRLLRAQRARRRRAA